MTDLRAAAQAALEALDMSAGAMPFPVATQARAALRAALAEPKERQSTHSAECYKWHHACAVARIEREQDAEPVAWMDSDGFPWSEEGLKWRSTPDTYTPLYTTPPRREWVGLTNEERLDFFDDYLARTPDGRHLFRHSWSYAEEEREAFDAGVAAAEAALKEKNT